MGLAEDEGVAFKGLGLEALWPWELEGLPEGPQIGWGEPNPTWTRVGEGGSEGRKS